MAIADQIRGWRDRWLAIDPAVTVTVARELLNAAAGPVASPFGTAEGLHDLRGISLTPAALGQSGRLSVGDRTDVNAHGPGQLHRWADIDFTGAELSHMNWFQHEVTSCRFDDVNLEHLRCWGVHVEDCSFHRVELHHSQLGAPSDFWPNRSLWRSIDMSQADLRHVAADVRFEHADFRNARFTATDFGWSDLIDCAFRGVVHGLTIGKLPVTSAPSSWTLSGIDLTEARPHRVELRGVNLGRPDVGIAFPNDAEHWHIRDWPHFLSRVAESISRLPAGQEKTVAAIWLDYATRHSGRHQSTGFIATWDLNDLGGQPLIDLLAGARS